MLALSASCMTEPQPLVARLELTVSETALQPGDTVRIVATNREARTVFITLGSRQLQQRDGDRWRTVVGLEGESNPTIDRAFGVAPGGSRNVPFVLLDGVGPGEYRISVDVYTESADTRPGTITTAAFSVSR
jgi:hypothetical protein